MRKMMIAAAFAVAAGPAIGQVTVVRDDRPRVAPRSQILPGIEAVRRRDTGGAEQLAVQACEVRLRAILDQQEAAIPA